MIVPKRYDLASHMKKPSIDSQEARQTLETQRVTSEEPGTILADVRAMLDFIGSRGISTSSQQGNLPAAVLPELNQRMSHPIKLNHKRALLRDYPNLAGVTILLRVAGLIATGNARVSVDPSQLARWDALNPTEQYFTLLEAWLLLASGEILGSDRLEMFSQCQGNLRFLAAQVSSRWQTFDEWIHVYHSLGGISAWNTQLQARFGLIEVAARPMAGRTSQSRAWTMERARRTPWGTAVAWALLTAFKVRDSGHLFFVKVPADAGFGYLQPVFQPFFPEWQQTFALVPVTAREGLFIFKVSLDPRRHGSWGWRRLAVPHHAGLYDLSTAVLQAFRFYDDDHLHEFRYRDTLGKTRVYNHPFSDERPSSDEITVGETDLPEKQDMRFWFDFGDNWHFILRLERIEPSRSRANKIRVLESAGSIPKQYPDYEE